MLIRTYGAEMEVSLWSPGFYLRVGPQAAPLFETCWAAGQRGVFDWRPAKTAEKVNRTGPDCVGNLCGDRL